MARFFIDRPVFAWVIAILIMLAGVLAIWTLPVSQYPAIAPPAIAITAQYPGASAQTVQDSVTQVIEQQMNGLDGLRYMSSTSESNGQATITLTFQAYTDTTPRTGSVTVGGVTVPLTQQAYPAPVAPRNLRLTTTSE